MGLLLGKANTSLSEFDTTNQNVKHNSFRINERSIDKSLQAYQFKEKAEFGYEFQFFSDANYQNLINLLTNRSSLREGLFLLPIPYSHQEAACGLVPTEGLHKAYEGNLTDPWNTPLGSMTLFELSSANYLKIRTYDTNYLETSGVGQLHYFFIFKFDLSSFLSLFSWKELRRMTLLHVGMYSSPIRFFAWSPLNNQWYLMDDRAYYDDTAFDIPGTGAFSLNKQLVSQLGLPWGNESLYQSFVDGSNIVTFMVSGGNIDQQILTQFVKLFVNGYWVNPDDPIDIENFSVAFTGAGRTGNIKLMEM